MSGILNYDPDDIPGVDRNAHREALSRGLHPIHVICDEPEAKVGDHEGVSFFAFVTFVPRVGEEIRLQDGTICQVRSVHYRVSQGRVKNLLTMFPNVYAVRIPLPKQ